MLYQLPNLKFLDSTKVTDSERREARRSGQFMKIIRPTFNNENENSNSDVFDTFTPLPKNIRRPDDYKGKWIITHDMLENLIISFSGSYGKCKYRYSGKHSEGNRFISNSDL